MTDKQIHSLMMSVFCSLMIGTTGLEAIHNVKFAAVGLSVGQQVQSQIDRHVSEILAEKWAISGDKLPSAPKAFPNSAGNGFYQHPGTMGPIADYIWTNCPKGKESTFRGEAAKEIGLVPAPQDITVHAYRLFADQAHTKIRTFSVTDVRGRMDVILGYVDGDSATYYLLSSMEGSDFDKAILSDATKNTHPVAKDQMTVQGFTEQRQAWLDWWAQKTAVAGNSR